MDKDQDKPVLKENKPENQQNRQSLAKFSWSPLYKFLWETFITAVIVITVLWILNHDIFDEIFYELK